MKSESKPDTAAAPRGSIMEILQVCFKLGLVAFGGPAAHIAMLQDEVVERRKWLSTSHFLDLVGATNLIPGPNSTQMVMHCGFLRGGWAGLLLGGSAFILPATLLTGILAYIYVEYQSVPAVATFMYGIKPAVIAIIAGAIYKLGQKALKGWQLGLIGLAVTLAGFLGVNEFAAILGGGVIGMLALQLRNFGGGDGSAGLLPVLLPVAKKTSWLTGLPAAAALTAPTAGGLFFAFLKIALLLFGSGYVLIAYVEGELINRLGWLSEAVLLDAIAIGQFTPGPVLSTATFIGYVLSGFEGALTATLGIFLPSFLLVGLLNPVIPRLRQSRWASAFLDAVNISALGIMLVVLIKLGIQAGSEWRSAIIMVLATLVAFRYRKLSSVWVVVGGALLGYGLQMI